MQLENEASRMEVIRSISRSDQFILMAIRSNIDASEVIKKYVCALRCVNATCSALGWVYSPPMGFEKGRERMGLLRKDVVGPLASWTFYWDRHDEGVFIGNRGSGKGVHVDQVLWSNARASQVSKKSNKSTDSWIFCCLAEVGKNWRGYKLVAAWPKGAVQDPGTNGNKKHRLSFLNCDL